MGKIHRKRAHIRRPRLLPIDVIRELTITCKEIRATYAQGHDRYYLSSWNNTKEDSRKAHIDRVLDYWEIPHVWEDGLLGRCITFL